MLNPQTLKPLRKWPNGGAIRRASLLARSGSECQALRRHSELVDAPEAALRSVFGFLGESYAPECLEPLKQRINSSNVADDFVASDPASDSALVEKATNLSAELETTAQSSERSNAAADALEAQFRERTQYVAVLDKSHEEAQRLIRALKKQNRDMTEAFDRA